MKIKALSVVKPFGDWIACGSKTIEVRSWTCDLSPDEDLLIVQNNKYLLEDGDVDPDGHAVAVVKIQKIREFVQSDMAASKASEFAPGYYSWVLSKCSAFS